MESETYIQSAKKKAPKDPYSNLVSCDKQFEMPLRPKALSEFVGQEELKDQLSVLIEAASMRKEPLSHCLLSGPPGLGKTTLAQVMAREMGAQFVVTSGPVLEKAGDLAGILSNLKAGDVLFIDEIHRLSKSVEEHLYPAMEDFSLDLVIDSGPGARSVQIQLEPFTLVGATTRQGLLSAPLRTRFPFSARLDLYDLESLQKILQRSAKILGIEMSEEVAALIGARSRGTPRIANNLLRWVRDVAQTRAEGRLSVEIAKAALAMLKIDEEGLDEMDRRLLQVLIEHYGGGPVGIGALATAVGEEAHTVEEVHEPYLILKGFLKRMSRGREASSKAYEHLGISQEEKSPKQGEFFS